VRFAPASSSLLSLLSAEADDGAASRARTCTSALLEHRGAASGGVSG
jgi:hypothetical protein